MICKEFLRHLESDVELTPDLVTQLNGHLDECESCRVQLAKLETMLTSLLDRGLADVLTGDESPAVERALRGLEREVLADIRRETISRPRRSAVKSCWGIFRETTHSPGRESDDTEILRL